MSPFELYLRNSFDPLTFGLFFGCLLLLAVTELAFELGQDPPERLQRWPVNWALTGLNILLLGAIPVTGLMVADMAASQGWGLFNLTGWSLPVTLILGLLLRSLSSWAVHLAMHKIPLLWRIHRVHHSDPEMDVSTTVRFHPLEFAIQLPVTLALILLAGIPPLAILIYELADAVIAAFSHANIRLPRRLERVLSWVIVTPHMHRIHHSSYQPETDSNYGATLSIWDRAFGTYRAKEAEALRSMTLGLTECRDARANRMTWLLALPFLGRRIPRLPHADAGKASERTGS